MKKFVSLILVIVCIAALAAPAMAAARNLESKVATIDGNRSSKVKFSVGRLDQAKETQEGTIDSERITFDSVEAAARALFHDQILQKGDSGTAIVILKRALIRLLDNSFEYGIVPTNSSFTANLENAVKKYQDQEGLDQDGIVGRETKDRLIVQLVEEETDLFHVMGLDG